MILAILSNRLDVENVIFDLELLGFRIQEISILLRNQVGSESTIADSASVDDVSVGVLAETTESLFSGIAGLLIGIRVIAVAGQGGIVVGGPLAAAIGLRGVVDRTYSGSVVRAFAGGLIEALKGLGISEDDARVYAKRVHEGGILVGIPDSEYTEVIFDILSEYAAENIIQLSENSVDKSIHSQMGRYKELQSVRHFNGIVGLKGGMVDRKINDNLLEEGES